MRDTDRCRPIRLHRGNYNAKKDMLRKQFQAEQKILEDMVAAHFKRDKSQNLGSDIKILKQSFVIDKIIVDKMKLDEIYDRYVLDGLVD